MPAMTECSAQTDGAGRLQSGSCDTPVLFIAIANIAGFKIIAQSTECAIAGIHEEHIEFEFDRAFGLHRIRDLDG